MKKIVIIITLLGVIQLFAQPEYTEIQIPMRDGQSLAADIYLPDSLNMPFPIIFIQTPYNKNLYRFNLPLGIGWNQSASNYAIVVMDWRCHFASLGACVLNPERGEDGYDAVEWMATQTWSDGKIGTYGPSALGNIQYMTAKEKPPHLVCMAPEVASPQNLYQNYYPGGAAKYEYIHQLGALFGVEQLYAAHPYFDATWQFIENATFYPQDIEVPTLILGGWYDINTDDNIRMFEGIASQSTAANDLKMLLGPWAHGGSSFAGGFGDPIQGELQYANADYNNRVEALNFFDYHLRNVDNNWDEKGKITYFQMGADEWQTTEVWPPNNAGEVNLFLNESHLLTFEEPISESLSNSYLYNPLDPQPTIGGQNLSLDQGPFDQRDSVENRADNLVFFTEVLTQDLEIKGKIKAKIYVSTDKLDTDFVLTLTDVYEEGRSMKICEQVQRMRFLNGYEQVAIQLLTPGNVYEVDLEFQNTAITIKEGHQLRLIISSSSYPKFNRNMNNGLEMYPNNNLDTIYSTQIAENKVHFDKNNLSKLVLPLYNFKVESAINDMVSSEISIFPNPSKGSVAIVTDLEIKQLAVFNVLGEQIIFELDENLLKLSSVESGIYFIRIQTENNYILTEKIVVE
ncbi:MAG: putative acyl esterase [Planctomycetota bacterium]|jgi:predicted acyl esterase